MRPSQDSAGGSPLGLAERVHEQALRDPHAPAVADGGRTLDYAALDTTGAAVADALSHAGVSRGQAVAVCLPRSWQLVCVMLGVLRLGARVVPLDAQSPPARRDHILRDSGSVVVIHSGEVPQGLPETVRPLTAEALLPAGEHVSQAGAPAAPGPVSFLFYTSGTTGRPKGVEVADAGILRLALPGYIDLPPGARYACLANPAFDALSFEVWAPLLTGGCCVILGDDAVRTPYELAAALRDERIDTVFVTVALFNAVVEAVPDCFAAARRVLVGGERLNGRIIRDWYRHNAAGTTRLHNVYGPTETSTFALCYPIPRDFTGDEVPIGRPLARTTALLVPAGGGRAAAPGEVAELYLAGEAVAVGYRSLPRETELRFVRLPWYDGGQARFYRTGDLASADAEGQLVFAGRADRQVKVRGFRIEPGELERHITTHPAVRQAYVGVRREKAGTNELLAFVVLGGEVSYEEFERHLAAGLPAYMRPHHTYRVGELPLNANGKVDQAALLERAGQPWRPAGDDGPVTPWQREVLDLAAEMLGTSRPRIGDRWIAAGGDSLKALRLRFEVRRRWSCELSSSVVMRGDFAEMAAEIDAARQRRGAAVGSPYPAVPAPSAARSAQATAEQQRLWLLQQRSPSSRAYHVGVAFRVEGEVDAGALRRALAALVERHVALRTGFEAASDGLFQLVGDAYDPWTEPGAADGEPGPAVAERFFAEPFDLARPRMLRACWLPRTGGGELLLHLHHIAVDGWSLNVLFQELSAGYARAMSGTETTPPVAGRAPTPVDFAGWQAQWFSRPAYQVLRDELRTHRAGLGEEPERLPSRGEGGLGAAQLLHTSLDAAQRAQVDRLCAELALTRFELLLGVFAWGVYGVTGLTRPRVAAPVANRPVGEFADSVGMFANTVLLPLAVAPGEQLRAQAARLGAGAREVLDRQDVTLADVLADLPPYGDGGPFDFLFVMENTDFRALDLPGCAVRPWWPVPAEAKCPMTLSVVEDAGALECLWEYADGYFTAAEVSAMADMFRRALDLLADDSTADVGAAAAPYRRSLPDHGRGAAVPPAWSTVAEGFARQVARTPDAPAVVSGDRVVDYAELDALAQTLALRLSAAHPEEADDGGPRCVALRLDPSVEHVVALLALARLNWTIVPLDPAYPDELLRHVLTQSQPLCVLVPPGGAAPLEAVTGPAEPPRYEIDLSAPAPSGRGPLPVHEGARPLYTLFTSGSTGTPKGVQVPDRTLSNLLQWQAADGGLGAPAVTQQFSMLSFDVSFQEVFGTLCGGGRLRLVRPGWRQDVPALLEQLESAGVERIFMPYVALQLLAEHGVHLNLFPSRLRDVIVAGEQLVCTDAVRRWFAGLPGVRLFNHYGPTETHVVSSLCLDGDPLRWPERPAIGAPVANASLRVVDEGGLPLPPGRAGELLIGGLMATRCYLGAAASDTGRFVELPDLGLFYRTGDRARFDDQGVLHYLGRTDQQVKLSGHRVELAQVEAALMRHPQIMGAVVAHDGEELTACLQCREKAATPSVAELTAHLSALLPAFIQIRRFRLLDALPHTPSGKLDRANALRAPGTELGAGPASGAAALSGAEARLAAVFEAVTGRPVGADETFFDAGASSLSLMRFHLRCTTELGLRFTVADLFEYVTIRRLARFVEQGREPGRPERSPATVRDEALPAAEPHGAGAPHSGGAPADEPIAVIGMAVRLPGARDLAEFWHLVETTGRGVEHFDAADGLVGARSQLAGLLAFDPERFGISRQDARLMDPQQRHLLMSCVEALAHAGITGGSAGRVGLVAGAGENTYFQEMLREADPERLPDAFQWALHHEKDFLATKVAYRLDLTGPAFTTQAACASSLVAVHVAAGLLRQGDADVMLAGGVLVDTTMRDGYRYQPQHIFSPDGHCRPFSDDAGGTIGGSGVGVVVLKPLRAALRDGDTVYARITGSALNNDGAQKLSYSAPSVAGQREVIRSALRRSGRTGSDLGYVEAHGTGTRLGDPIEVEALRQAFGVSEPAGCALASVKSQIGHLGAAAGVIGLVRAVLGVHHGLIPPNADFRALNPAIGSDAGPFYIPARPRPWPADRPRVAAVSSFGIGGTNAHVVLEAAPASPAAAAGPAGSAAVPRCLVLAGHSRTAVRADAERIADYLAALPHEYPRVVRHLQAGRPQGPWRMATVCDDPAAAVTWLRTAEPAMLAGASPLSPVEGPSAASGTADTAPARPDDRPAPALVAAWLAGESVGWPAGPAQAPWDFPPPSFDLADYDFPRLPTAAPAPAGPALHTAPVPASVPSRLPEGEWLRQPTWTRLRRANSAEAHPVSQLLVLVTDETPAADTVRAFAASYARVVRVRAAESFARLDENDFAVDPADPEALRQLLGVLPQDGPYEGIDWVHTLPLSVHGPVGTPTLERARWACLDAPAALAQALAGRTDVHCWWLSYGARPVEGPVSRPELALLAGITEVAPQESLSAGTWLDLPTAGLARWAAAVAHLTAAAPALPRQLVLRQGYWWEQSSVPVPAPGDTGPVMVPEGAVYLVLGGTGGIGRATARWLLERGAGRVLLLARQPELPEELEPWADRVELVTSDLSELTPGEVLARIGGCTDRLDGVVHAAGVAAGGLTARRDAAAVRDATAAKLNGALLIEELVRRYAPAVVLYCSSMSAQLGGIGQLDYAAAGAALDAFAHHRSADLETTARMTVDWDVWRESGMALRAPASDARHQAHVAVGLTTAEAERVFDRVLGAGLPHLLVSTTDLRESETFYAPPRLPVAEAAATPVPAGPATGEDPAGLLTGLLCEWLGVEDLDPAVSLYDLGADSLTMLDLIGAVKQHFGVELELSRLSHRVGLDEVLERLREAAPQPAAADGVPLEVWQEGTGSDVLCLVHPVGGDIQAYRTLVSALDPRLTVCLVADPALREERGPEWSLTERARRYDSALRAQLGQGVHRVSLAGWSFGGWVALEMAALAEREGRPVDGLFLLDPPPPGSGMRFQDYDESQLEALFAHELGQAPGQTPGGAAGAYAERLARCCRANLRSMAAHTLPRLTVTPVRTWLATRPVRGLPVAAGPAPEHPALWRPYLPDGSSWQLVETTHYGIVGAPHAQAVAEAINSASAARPPARSTDPSAHVPRHTPQGD